MTTVTDKILKLQVTILKNAVWNKHKELLKISRQQQFNNSTGQHTDKTVLNNTPLL